METSAAQIVSHVLFDELKQGIIITASRRFASHPETSSSFSSLPEEKAIKEACVRASFRLLHTALQRRKKFGHKNIDGTIDVIPFDALGEAAFLVDIVAEAQVNYLITYITHYAHYNIAFI